MSQMIHAPIRSRAVPAGALTLALALFGVIGVVALMAPRPVVQPSPLVVSVPAYTPAAPPQSIQPMGISITPITTVAAGSSGLAFSGDAYDVSCTVSAATGTLYPAMHDGTAWTVYYAYPCALDGSVVTKATCIFPARRGAGLTWNAFKTGSATINACTAEQRYTGGSTSAVPPTPASSSLSTPVSVANGGTAIASYATGDILYASAGTTLSKLAIGSNGHVLTVASGVPTWAAASGGSVRKEIAISWSGGFGITASQTDQYGIPPYTAGTGFTNDYPYVALRAGSLTGISIMLNTTSSVSGGSLTAKFFKNGSAVASAEAAITSGTSARATFSAGTYTVAAGDKMEIRWTTTGAYVGPSGGSFSIEVTES